MQRKNRNSRSGRSHAAGSGNSTALNAALGIAGGIGIGAALMYLLDPDQGNHRRHHLADKASGTMHGAWDAVSAHAADVGAAAASAIPAVGERLMHHAHDAGDTMQDARESAGGWLASARSHLPGSFSALNPWRRRERRYIVPVAAAAAATGAGLAALAIGAGAMFLFDPDRGRGRRAWIMQKAQRVVNETGQFMRATGRHLRNKGQGYYHETRAAAESAMEKVGRRYASAPIEDPVVPSI